jgi:hypothetical protein
MKHPSSQPPKIKQDTKLFKVGFLLLVLGDITPTRATLFPKNQTNFNNRSQNPMYPLLDFTGLLLRDTKP